MQDDMARDLEGVRLVDAALQSAADDGVVVTLSACGHVAVSFLAGRGDLFSRNDQPAVFSATVYHQLETGSSKDCPYTDLLHELKRGSAAFGGTYTVITGHRCGTLSRLHSEMKLPQAFRLTTMDFNLLAHPDLAKQFFRSPVSENHVVTAFWKEET